jgi:hypothetical protein
LGSNFLKERRKAVKKVLSSILLALVVLALVAQPALAKPADDTEWQYTKAIERLEPFLSVTETGNIVLNPPRGVIKSIKPNVYLSLLAGLQETNRMIDQGYLTVGDGFALTVTEAYLVATAGGQLIYENTVAATSTYSGVTKVVWYWWGFKLYLSHANCVRLAAGLGIAAAIATLIPEPLASKVVAIIMASLVGTIMVTDVNDTGVIIRFHYLWIAPVVIFTGIWPQ